MTPWGGVKAMKTPLGGRIKTGGERDSLKSMNFKVLIQSFKLIPNIVEPGSDK